MQSVSSKWKSKTAISCCSWCLFIFNKFPCQNQTTWNCCYLIWSTCQPIIWIEMPATSTSWGNNPDLRICIVHSDWIKWKFWLFFLFWFLIISSNIMWYWVSKVPVLIVIPNITVLIAIFFSHVFLTQCFWWTRNVRYDKIPRMAYALIS